MKSPNEALKKIEPLPPLLARLVLATAFGVSGTKKFRSMKEDIEYFRQIGIPMPEAMTPFVATTEVTCASLLGAGFLTRAAALPLIGVMTVAILTARRKDFHSFPELTGIYEFSYILLLSYLAVYGGGKLSVDALRQVQSARVKRPSSLRKSRRAA